MDDNSQVKDDEILTFKITVITPQCKVYEGEVLRASMIGAAGEFDLLPRHEPFLSPLKVGIMTFEVPTAGGGDPEEVTLAVHGGFLDMNGVSATVFATSAERANEIDLERAKEAQKRAAERIEQVTLHPGDEVPMDIDRAQLALMRALLRVQVAERFGSSNN